MWDDDHECLERPEQCCDCCGAPLSELEMYSGIECFSCGVFAPLFLADSFPAEKEVICE